MTKTRIDLGKFTQGKTRNLSGHERGLHAREMFGLDDLDHDPDAVHVQIPEELDAIAPSFFQGLFSQSVRALGGRDEFLAHYQFVASPWVMQQIERGVRRSLISRDGAFG